MQLDLYSLVLITVLSIALKTSFAIKGCVVTLASQTSVRRKVLCANPDGPIESIPEDLPLTTDMLIISGQNISNIKEDDFQIISDMTILMLTFSRLQRIHVNSFRSLTHLISLDLTGNNLTISQHSLPSRLFTNLSELRFLRLSKNPLTSIPDLFFRPMSIKLQRIFLNHCGSPSLNISPRAFKGLHHLEELDLRENGIVSLLPPLESDLQEMKSLKYLLLGGNNFLCDCKFRWFYFYLRSVQEVVETTIEGDKNQLCTAPKNFISKHFPKKDDREKMRYSDFICPSKCSAIGGPQISASAGASINLTCSCFTDPIQQVSWTKNDHIIHEIVDRYRIFHSGKENIQTTLNINSLQSSDSGNWSCKVDKETSQTFFVKIKPNLSLSTAIHVYILVGLGSTILLISLVVIIVVIFCRREDLCQFRSHHPMVICGYGSTIRKHTIPDGDGENQYYKEDGRFHTTFYENTIPFDPSLSYYPGTNHLFPEDSINDFDLKKGFSKLENQNLANDPDSEIMKLSYSYRSQSLKPAIRGKLQHNHNDLVSSQRRLHQIEKQCPFHTSSGTLTRIPGEKPCPVHGSTATLPSRLSSKKTDHQFGCPKHNKDNISVKSLKLENCIDDRMKPHRNKSLNKIPAILDASENKSDVQTAGLYKPCPLHGDVLAAINENINEPKSRKTPVQPNDILLKKTRSKEVQGKSCRKPLELTKNRTDHFPKLSVGTWNTMISPVQSSLSSSPLLTSDVHGTLV